MQGASQSEAKYRTGQDYFNSMFVCFYVHPLFYFFCGDIQTDSEAQDSSD